MGIASRFKTRVSVLGTRTPADLLRYMARRVVENHCERYFGIATRGDGSKFATRLTSNRRAGSAW
jgi:hypothetical protein